MKLTVIPAILATCGAAAAAAVARTPSSDAHDRSSDPLSARGHRIPTAYESAVMGRRILALSPLGTLSTVFPEDKEESGSGSGPGAAERRPSGLGGVPLGLVDYVADCEDEGNPTILAVDIATHFRNVRAGSNISLAVRWAPPHPPSKRISSSSSSTSSPPSFLGRLLDYLFPGQGDSDDSDSDHHHHHEPIPYSAANLPRFSLMGYLEDIPSPAPTTSTSDSDIADCFVAAHPDARHWLPGNRIHRSHFVRLVVTSVYWVGGFGDRAYIGWIPADDWAAVSRDEWEAVRLPGERKGWDEWAAYDESPTLGGDDL